MKKYGIFLYVISFLLIGQISYSQSTVYVDAATGNDANSGFTHALAKQHIQAGIDVVSSGGTVNVYPGNYTESAVGRSPLSQGGTYTFGLFISTPQNGITVQGVNASGIPVTDFHNILANVKCEATDNFGPDGIFMEGDNVTITGLKIWQDTALGTNKTISVIGNNFTMKYCHITDVAAVEPWGSLYFTDNWYDAGTNTSHIQSYDIESNWFDNCSMDPNNGAGYSGPVSGRKILNNLIELGSWAGSSISFTGTGTGVPWFVYGVGGAIITGNTFHNNLQHIRARGTYDNSQFDWASYWNNNTFDKGVITGVNPPADIREYSYVGGYGTISHVRRIGASILGELANASAGDVIKIGPGTYTEDAPQIVINKNITFSGVNKNTVILRPAQNTGNSGDLRGWILVNSGMTFNLNNVTLDGAGKLVSIGILSHGPGTINNNIIKNCGYNQSGPDYAGRGIAFYDVNMSITNNSLSNIGRIGIYMNGAGVTNGVVSGNTFTGKGNGNWLDYGIEIENAAHGFVTNNTVSNCTGIASVDGSTSAGIYATTYFANGTQEIVNNNVMNNNYVAIEAGYDANDSTVAVAHNNSFNGNTYGLVSTSPHAVIDGINNWWGSSTGPRISTNPGGTGDSVTANVLYNPWIGSLQTINVTNGDLNNNINFTEANTTMNFSTLPPGTSANVSVQRLTSPPAGVPLPPASAGSVCPLYLTFDVTGLANYTFQVTITVDVSTIPGFAAGTEVMFYSNVSHSWVGLDGTYDPVMQTYTFTTNHFTPFTFVNPLNPDGLYICQDNNNPATTQKWYPTVGMGTGTTYGPNDWTYTNDTARFYVVPTGTQGMFATKFQIQWDKSKAGNLTVTNGNMYGNSFFQAIDSSVGSNGRYWINISSSDLSNVVPGSGKYLAVLKFGITTPGYIPITIVGTDFRYYNGTGTDNVYVTTNPGAMLFYLGDFESPSSQNIGDGKINSTDITNFFTAYWSLSSGSLYRAKYDVGPTDVNGSYWAMPTPDGRIEFEDLVIFSIGYGKYAAGQLPQNKLNQPVVVAAGDMTLGEDGLYRLPVNLSGGVNDVRAMSLSLNYNSSTLEYAGVEKQGELVNNTSFLIGKAENNKIYMDASLVGTPQGISTAGTTANILFRQIATGNHGISINSAMLRNSQNGEITAKFGTDAGNLIPKTFGLSQNYPNPFNPVTTIKYQIPSSVKVTIKVYDILGRVVATLVDGVQEAGYYNVDWNAGNYASGIYFYRMNAGSFESVKKLVLVK